MNCVSIQFTLIFQLLIMINFSKETKICDMMIAVDEPLFWHYQGNTKKLVEMIKIHVEKWNEIYSRGPIIHFYDDKSLSRCKYRSKASMS